MEPKPDYGNNRIPCDVESEEAFLGAVLLQGGQVITQDAPDLKPEDFYVVKHQWIFEAMLELKRLGHAIDIVTVNGMLGARGAEAGGLGYLTKLLTNIPTSMHAEAYAFLIMRESTRRKLLVAAAEIARVAYAETLTPLEDAKQVLRAIESPTDSRDIASAADIADEVWDEVKDIDHLNDGLIRSGLEAFDVGCGGGIERGSLVLLAGRPGMGKTALECQLGYGMSASGLVVVKFQLEMKKQQIVRRMAFQQARMNWMAYKAHQYRGADEQRAFEALVKEFSRMPETLLIDDTPSLSIDQVEAKLMRVADKFGRIDAIFGDHLSLFRPGSRAKKSENGAITAGHISRAAKEWAKIYNAASIFACQLNRGSETRSDARPMLSDLRDTGEHEQNADVVIGLYRNAYYTKDKNDTLFENIVLKNRDGETSTQRMNFFANYGLFEDLSNANARPVR